MTHCISFLLSPSQFQVVSPQPLVFGEGQALLWLVGPSVLSCGPWWAHAVGPSMECFQHGGNTGWSHCMEADSRLQRPEKIYIITR